jgi:hypothetical protein
MSLCPAKWVVPCLAPLLHLVGSVYRATAGNGHLAPNPLLWLLGIMSQYAIRKVQENYVGLKLNGTHQLLVYADDMTLLGDTIDAKKKNRNFN